MATSAEDLSNWGQPVTLTLRSGPASVRSARRFTSDLLSRWGLVDMRDDVLLCLSELVSNAVVYAGSTVGLQVSRAGTSLRLEVRDQHALDDRFAEIVRVRQEHHAHPPLWQPAEGGRGLLLVDELSEEWGVAQDPDVVGKVVWCVVASPVPQMSDALDVSAPERAPAVLLGVPVGYLMAHERRIRTVLKALGSAADPSPEQRQLAAQIDRVHRRHLNARLQSPIDLAGTAVTERVDVAFDSSENPYLSAAELARVVGESESLVGKSAPPKGLDAGDMEAFERWYLEELRRQANGQGPLPCPFPARPSLSLGLRS